ncbi:MBL fold metallo-hydrolase [Alcaligenaceae bacterium CGII-47]|nr:MBL fold metallo-hydrolase [Alcaligenaceae bacterium CGII-47]
MTSYAQQRDARIDAYLKLVGAPQPLDILFISHAHADHLNGVERLLNQGNGLAVQVIVRPGDPEHGSPFSRGPEESGDGPGDSAGLLYGDMPWNLVGTGSINSTLPGEPDGSVVMPDSLGMVCTSDATPPA